MRMSRRMGLLGKKETVPPTLAELFADMTVRAPGQKSNEIPDGGVRVKKMLPQQTASKPVICSVCGKEITDVEINGVKYTVPQILKSTKNKCYNCYVAEKQSENKE